MRFGVFSFLAPIFLLIALFWGSSVGLAEVSRETVERLGQISVEKQELRHLNAVTKITSQEYSTRLKALNAEERTLWEPYRRIPSAEKQAAQTAITGFSRSKLSLLEPQWEKEEWALRKDTEKRREQTALDVDQNARQAVEFQRQRMILQRQLDKGTIDRAAFTAKDHEALAAIEALRNKHDPHYWGARFDNRLSLLTKALADNPDTFIARSQVPATGEGEPDFDRDVKLAADIYAKTEEVAWKFEKKQISIDTLRESTVIYQRDLKHLYDRYQATKRGDQFTNAYKRMAAPELQALKVKYYPERYRPAAPTSPTPQPAPRPPETDYTLAYWLGGGVILLFIFWLGSDEEPASAPASPPVSNIHGSATWATRQKDTGDTSLAKRGVIFGASSHPDIPATSPGAIITSLPETHTLIVARTRAGKGTRVIVPTLLHYAHSMLVIDPKGENAAITARTRRDQLNQTVHIVNPWGELKDHYAKLGFETATFNPLDAIDRNDPNAVSVAQSLAATICPVADPREQFWQGSAANVLAGVLLWITDQPGEQKTLARAREIVSQSREDFKRNTLVRMMVSTAFDGAIKEMVSQYYDLADETYSGIMSNLAQSTKFLSDPQIKASTATSSFSMENIRDKYMTVYIVIPHDRLQTHSTWLRLVIASAMQALKNRSRIATPPHHRCMFLIDEFGSIGHIADVPRDIAIMSGYGLDFTLIVQGLDQLKHHYGEAKNTILSNCAYKWFCYINELDTAKYLSESLGKKTVRTVGQSKSQGVSGEHPTEGESTTYGETGRELLTPDEILNLGRDIAILLNPLTRPHYLRPVDYWKLAEAFSAPQKASPFMFSLPPALTYDDNPYWNNPNPSKRPPKVF